MVASSEDARLLFNRWIENSQPLRIKLSSSALFFDAVGIMTSVNADVLQCHGDSWTLTIPVADAAFSFSDPREVSIKSVRELEAARYEFGISVDLPNQDRIAILELKGPEGEETEETEEPSAE